MLDVIVKLLGVIMVLIGIILVYDARIITKRFFGFGDQNDASQRLENIGLYYCYYWRINYLFYKNLSKIA